MFLFTRSSSPFLFRLRRFSSKANSSNALMESVNLAGINEEYLQVSFKRRIWELYPFVFLVG